ncbi:MAG: MBOAT family protein [Aureispira sp.]|nr:MBOAT family protein [Aureispira sp.]
MDLGAFFSNFWELLAYDKDNPILFSSGQFLLFFTLFYAVYIFLYDKVRARIFYVLAFSLFFYYKSSGWYVVFLGLTVVFNYGLGIILEDKHGKKGTGWALFAGVIVNLLPLFYFKYTNFFASTFTAISGGDFIAFDIFLPIGISFFTFQTISYIADVYKGDIKACRDVLDFGFYLSFFPQLVAGPIVRAKDFLPQIHRKINFQYTARENTEELIANPPAETEEEVDINRAHLGEGLFMILKGFVKKAIIADYIALYVSLIYGDPTCIYENTYSVGTEICGSPMGYSGFENLMAMYAYTLQIYCDFSGYSDMAIGIALLMGFKLPENFRSPYKARNITDFWRRWHISLSFWLRDYIYIALGGNRKGIFKRYWFLMVTMLVGGWWHGASWKFVFWGGMHGLGLILHKFWLKVTNNWKGNVFSKVVAWLITFHFVAFLWVFFRAESFEVATISIGRMFTDFDWAYLAPFWSVRQLLMVILFIGFGIHFIKQYDKQRMNSYFASMPAWGKALVFLFFIQLAIQLQSADVQPFIYFQF